MDKLQVKQQEANRIIDGMGGTVKVAELFNITTGGVSQWREKGIPASRLFAIKLLRPDLFGELPNKRSGKDRRHDRRNS
jgi:hypothetical protein